MKKSLFFTLILSLTVMSVTITAETVAERFSVDVGMLPQKQIKNIPQNFIKIDLSEFATRNIRDEVAGDGTGGWSDQGDNDLRMFDKFGAQEMLGVPFDFIDPAKNNNKAVLALRGQNDMELPTSVEIPIDTTTAGAYFVQASPWCSGICGTYTWVYADGREAYVDIEKNIYICDFWGYSSYDYCRPCWTAEKSDGSKRTLYLFAMNNPYPDKEVKALKLSTTGSGAYIMIMAITLTDSGPYLEQVESAKYRTTSTYGWFPYEQPSQELRKGGILDFSYMLDAPAGKYGKVIRKGSDLLFENGQKVKFFGVDLVGMANFPEKEAAPYIAKEIAMDGVNIVRMTDIDDIIYGKKKSHSAFDEEMKDRLMYFISQLKENGVYIYLSVISDFQLYESDNVENYRDFSRGLGFDGFWDSDLIALQKRHLHLLMNTMNDYTKMTLLNDPAVAMVEFAGCKSVTDYTTGWGRNAVANKNQQNKLNVIFSNYLQKKYLTTDNLSKKWSSYDLTKKESIEEKTVQASGAWRNILHSDNYKKDMSDFLGNLLSKYFNEMRKETASKLSTSNSNMPNVYSIIELKAASEMDFTARNSLFAQLFGRTDKLSENSVFAEYDSPVVNMEKSSALELAHNAVATHPFVCGYGAGLPNLYFSAENIMTTAFAAQNNWLPIQHSYANGDYANDVMDDAYSVYDNPVKRAILPLTAMMYYSMECLPENKYNVYYDELSGINIPTKDVYTKNTRVGFSEKDTFVSVNNKKIKTIKTENIFWDSHLGLFEARTPKVELLSGFVQNREEMPSFSVETVNTYISAVLASGDKNNIDLSGDLLLTLVCGNQNKGNSVNIIKNAFTNIGAAPILIEGISADIILKLKGEFDVWALDTSGRRKTKISVKKNEAGYCEFSVLPDYKAMQYEIRRK